MESPVSLGQVGWKSTISNTGDPNPILVDHFAARLQFDVAG